MPKKPDKRPKITRKQKLAAAKSNINNEAAGLPNPDHDVTVQLLEIPVKPDTDKNQYRVIRLPNGLTAVLIAHDNPEVSQNVYDREEDGSGLEDPNYSDALKCGEDDSQNWYEKILNKAEVDSEAACRLCINVGSFSELSYIAGLTRVLPIVIIIATAKYPWDNEFSGFVSDHGSRAMTDFNCEKTSFDFHVPEPCLRDGIDRFSQCFISPLMKRSAIMRKRAELEEEYRDGIEYPMYVNRKEHLYSKLAPYGHPCTKFGEHYLEGMCQAPDKKFCKEVIQFRERHYSAHRMAVVLEARLPLDTLEEYIKENFSKIPNTGYPPDDFSHFNYAECFNMKEFRKLYEMKDRYGLVDGKTLEITWTMPPRQRSYRSKPQEYIAWILNHKGKGSLFSYLWEKKLCHKVYSRIGQDDFENNSVWSLFTISLGLSPEGDNNRNVVIEAVYSYINLIRREGPQKRLFDEMRNIVEADFRFTDDVRSSTPYQDLFENMHLYPPSEYLTGSVLFFDYDPAAIKSCVKLLKPNRANIIVYVQDFEESENVIEDSLEEEGPVYFEREYYFCNDIDDDWLISWKNVTPYPELCLPEANPFVANDFTMISIPENPSEVPEKIDCSESYEIWYKYDTKFRSPKCHMLFGFISSLPMLSSENAAMTDLLISALKQVLFEELYPAKTAKLNYDIDCFADRLEVRLYGFNQKLPLLMQTITKYIRECSNLVSEELFEIAKNEQLKLYHKIFCAPENLVDDVKLSILRDVNWTALDKHTGLSRVQFYQFEQFLEHFADRLYVKCLVQGNMSKSDAIENAKKCVELLNYKPLPIGCRYKFRVNEIFQGLRCCRVTNMDSSKPGCVVKNYYQFGEFSIENSVLIDLLSLITRSHILEEFRSLKQLSPGTCRVIKENFGILGYSLTIESYPWTYESGDIAWGDDNLEKYRQSLNKLFNDMPDKDLLGLKRILLKLKGIVIDNFSDDVFQNWTEIMSGEYIFDRQEREFAAVKEFQIKELRNGLLNLTAEDDSSRKLSMQTAGYRKNEENTKLDENNKNSKAELGYLGRYFLKYSMDLVGRASKNQYYITDIEDYKKELKGLSSWV